MVAATGAEVVAGAPDAEAITEQTGVAVTRTSSDGDTIPVGSCSLRVIRADRPHARLDRPAVRRRRPASRTCSPATRSSPAASATPAATPTTSAPCIDDVETKLFGPLPDETWFYPGHGNDSTLGAERPHLAEWRERGW